MLKIYRLTLDTEFTLQPPPKPSRRQGGWADDTTKEKKKGYGTTL